MPLILNGSTGISGIDGSAGTPSYQGTDSDTGLWYPAANTVALSTGGSERLRIDSSGNVGIGTSTITSGAGWSPRLVLGSTDVALIVKGSGGQESSFGTSGGLYLDCLGNSTGANNNIVFRNTNVNSSFSALERMRIDSSGNVGIGNTPSGTSATGYRSLELGTTAGTGITAGNGDFYVPVNAYVAGGAWKYATTSTASLLNIQGGLFTWSNAGSGTAGNNISFSERMRITSAGEVLVGRTSAYNFEKFSVFAPQPTAANWWVSVLQTAATSTQTTMMAFLDGANDFCGQIYIDPPSNTTIYSTSSDYRLKDNVAPMAGALAKVQALNPVTYTWKKSGKTGQGFIAHELQEIVPECVVGEKDAMRTYIDEEGNEQTAILPQMVDTSFLVATLTAAIKEQQAMIEELKAEVAALKASH